MRAVGLLLLLFAIAARSCRLDRAKKALPLAYPLIDTSSSATTIQLPFMRNNQFYTAEISTKPTSTPQYLAQQRYERDATSSASTNHLQSQMHFGRVLGIPNSYILGYFNPIARTAAGKTLYNFVGEVIIPASPGTTEERFFYDDAVKFIDDTEQWKGLSVHSILYRVGDLESAKSTHDDVEEPRNREPDDDNDEPTSDATSSVCSVDIYMHKSVFDYFLQSKSLHFAAKNEQARENELAKREQKQIKREEVAEERAKQQTKNLGAFLIEALNTVYRAEGLSFKIRMNLVYDRGLCRTLNEEEENWDFIEDEEPLMCNIDKSTEFETQAAESAFASGLLNRFSRLKAVKKSPACVSVLFMRRKLINVMGKAFVGNDPYSGACALLPPSESHRGNTMIIELNNGTTGCLQPLVEMALTTAHEIGHLFSLKHTHGGFLMNNEAVKAFGANYFSLGPVSTRELRNRLAKLHKKKEWELRKGVHYNNCFQ